MADGADAPKDMSGFEHVLWNYSDAATFTSWRSLSDGKKWCGCCLRCFSSFQERVIKSGAISFTSRFKCGDRDNPACPVSRKCERGHIYHSLLLTKGLGDKHFTTLSLLKVRTLNDLRRKTGNSPITRDHLTLSNRLEKVTKLPPRSWTFISYL